MECLPLVHTVLRMRRSKDWVRVSVMQDGQQQTMHQKPVKYAWEPTAIPNRGRSRNIPTNAIINQSVKMLYDAGVIESMSMMRFGPEGFAQVQNAQRQHGSVRHMKAGDYMFVY